MSEGIKLKSSLLGGYNKKDVLQTIEQLSQQATTEVEKYKEEVKTVKNKNKSLSDEVDAFKKRIMELEAEMEEKNQRIDQLSECIESAGFDMENKSNSYKGRITELEWELEERNQRLNQLSESIRSTKAELENKDRSYNELKQELDRVVKLQNEKEAHYEKVSKGIGEMMVNVKFTCDGMIASTKEEVETVITEANNEISQIGNQVRNNKQQFADSRAQIMSYIKTVEENLNKIYDKMDATENEIFNEKIIKANSVEFKKCQIDIENKVADLLDSIKNG